MEKFFKGCTELLLTLADNCFELGMLFFMVTGTLVAAIAILLETVKQLSR